MHPGRLAPLAAFLLLFAGCGPAPPLLLPEETVTVPNSGTVVVYVEAPRYIAGPVLRMFSEQTGITVEARYREEVGDGFYETLKSEAAAGHVDLVWTASPLLALDLVRASLALPFRPAGARVIPGQYHDRGFQWIGFAVTPRVIIFNQDLVSRDEAPQSIDDLAAGPWSGRGAMARIARGPAAFQAAAILARRGDDQGLAVLEAVRARGTRIVESEAEVRRLVAAGEAAWGVLDLDQAICAKRQAEPVSIFFADRMGQGAVVVPHSAVLMRNAPNPAQAKGLFGYFFETETAFQIGNNDCALLSLLPLAARGIPKPEWVPYLGAVNVMALDNGKVHDAYVRHAAYLAGWGPKPPGS